MPSGIVLLNGNDTIEIVVGGTVTANQLSYVVTYLDYSAQGEKALPVTSYGLTNDSTAVTIVPAIDQRKANRRILQELHIFNADTTAEDIIVQLNANGTIYKMWKENLAADKSLQYVEGDGFLAQP